MTDAEKIKIEQAFNELKGQINHCFNDTNPQTEDDYLDLFKFFIENINECSEYFNVTDRDIWRYALLMESDLKSYVIDIFLEVYEKNKDWENLCVEITFQDISKNS